MIPASVCTKNKISLRLSVCIVKLSLHVECKDNAPCIWHYCDTWGVLLWDTQWHAHDPTLPWQPSFTLSSTAGRTSQPSLLETFSSLHLRILILLSLLSSVFPFLSQDSTSQDSTSHSSFLTLFFHLNWTQSRALFYSPSYIPLMRHLYSSP